MAKKKAQKKMSNVEAAKTIVREGVKVHKLKGKIRDRKATNAALKRKREGKALRAGDSRRLAEAEAAKMNKKRSTGRRGRG